MQIYDLIAFGHSGWISRTLIIGRNESIKRIAEFGASEGRKRGGMMIIVSYIA